MVRKSIKTLTNPEEILLKSIKFLTKILRKSLKSIRFLTKSFRISKTLPNGFFSKIISCHTKFLGNPFKINYIPYHILQNWIKFLTKPSRNQINSLPKLWENQLNSLPNPSEMLWKSIEFLTQSFRK